MSTDVRLLVTGGAGFIGSHFVRHALARGAGRVVVLDKLTYAGRLENLSDVVDDPRVVFVRGDIADRALVTQLLEAHQPGWVAHLAAESHVDRSIDGAAAFVETNVVGTFHLLEATRRYWSGLLGADRERFRFLNVSTDEVFGSLGASGAFHEESPYAPNSPYAASKAAADHLVRATGQTHGLPVLHTHATNNFGTHQLPEKLIPLMIRNAREGRPLPLYGDGLQVRDWLHVADHCSALWRVLEAAEPGARFNVGARGERTNRDLVSTLCGILDEIAPRQRPYAEQITFVTDRPGHDRRYAVDPSRLERTLRWRPAHTFEDGLRATVRWYLDHEQDVTPVHRERLGLAVSRSAAGAP